MTKFDLFEAVLIGQNPKMIRRKRRLTIIKNDNFPNSSKKHKQITKLKLPAKQKIISLSS